MGTGTSTLSAIESLSSSLQEIERKLAVLEDSHLHHEKTICFDDSVIVSGKRIQVYLLAHCILFYSYFLPIFYVLLLLHAHSYPSYLLNSYSVVQESDWRWVQCLE